MPQYRIEGSERWLYTVTADTKEEAEQKIVDAGYRYRDQMIEHLDIEVVEEMDAEV
jgi:hypothetical protein